MNTSALIMMVVANAIVITVTASFFIRILRKAPPPDAVDEDEANYPRGG